MRIKAYLKIINIIVKDFKIITKENYFVFTYFQSFENYLYYINKLGFD